MNGRPAPETVGPAACGNALGPVRRRMGFAFAADGSYAACLAETEDGAWYPERWTLAGPEAYTVPLPGAEPEVPGRTSLLPLTDGRVLVCRHGDDGHRLALLYPTGPSTAELPVGTLDLDDVRLLALPAASGPSTAHTGWHAGPVLALAVGCSTADDGTVTTSVWLVSSSSGPDPDDTPQPCELATLPGRHLGGTWLDRDGRLLALDKVDEGRTKTVVLEMESGQPTPLLQIAEDSNDRLLLADPESGLLVVRSDAPGSDRVGWGVLGSARPIRFPECLAVTDGTVTPFAVQPGAPLTPEDCGVALRVEERGVSRLAVWRPARRALDDLVPPPGWFLDTGHWSAEGLRLPYAHEGCPFGVALLAGEATEPPRPEEKGRETPKAEPEQPGETRQPERVTPDQVTLDPPAETTAEAPSEDGHASDSSRPASPDTASTSGNGDGAGSAATPPLRTPVPLQQSPLTTAQA